MALTDWLLLVLLLLAMAELLFCCTPSKDKRVNLPPSSSHSFLPFPYYYSLLQTIDNVSLASVVTVSATPSHSWLALDARCVHSGCVVAC